MFDHLHTFGCVCFVHLPLTERTKLTAQSRRCAFLGYATNQKGFVCYDPIGRHIRVSRNVIFFENQYFLQTHMDCPQPSSPALLPGFSDQTTVTRFNPDFVYHRRDKPTLQMAVLLILLRQMVSCLRNPCVAPPELLDRLRCMDLPILL